MLKLEDIKPLEKVVVSGFDGYWVVISVDIKKNLVKCIRTNIQFRKFGTHPTRITEIFPVSKLFDIYKPKPKEDGRPKRSTEADNTKRL